MRHAFPWLSPLLLLLANLAFGLLLHRVEAPVLLWILALAYTVLECSIVSIVWQPFRNLLLLGFKSAAGYSFTALLGASFAVVLVVWANISSYFLVVLAAGLLLRMDLFTRRISSGLTFAALVIVSAIGLALSWLLLPLLTWL